LKAYKITLADSVKKNGLFIALMASAWTLHSIQAILWPLKLSDSLFNPITAARVIMMHFKQREINNLLEFLKMDRCHQFNVNR
jgi:hypothetical protein